MDLVTGSRPTRPALYNAAVTYHDLLLSNESERGFVARVVIDV